MENEAGAMSQVRQVDPVDGRGTGGRRPLKGRLTWFKERPRARYADEFEDLPPPKITVSGVASNPVLLCSVAVVAVCLLVSLPCGYYEHPWGSSGWDHVSTAFSEMSGGLGEPLARSCSKSLHLATNWAIISVYNKLTETQQHADLSREASVGDILQTRVLSGNFLSRSSLPARTDSKTV